MLLALSFSSDDIVNTETFALLNEKDGVISSMQLTNVNKHKCSTRLNLKNIATLPTNNNIIQLKVNGSSTSSPSTAWFLGAYQ